MQTKCIASVIQPDFVEDLIFLIFKKKFLHLIRSYQKHLLLAPSLRLPVISSLLIFLPAVLQEWARLPVNKNVRVKILLEINEHRVRRFTDENVGLTSCCSTASCCFFFIRFSFSFIFSLSFFFSETFGSAN